jgi:enamine deaminase RidA (YjgF/YER057c/UK114 family)
LNRHEHFDRVLRLQGDPASPFEEPFAFSRVVRAGPHVLVGGTTSIDPSGAVLGETPYEQAVAILRKIGHELSRAGASLHDVVLTRIYTTDISRAEDIARAHREAFSSTRPVTTMVEVSALIDPRMIVEIEAMAFVPDLGRAA